MNLKRRRRLDQVLEQLREIAEEERTAHGNLPEAIQASERGEKMDEIASVLEQAIDDIEGVLP